MSQGCAAEVRSGLGSVFSVRCAVMVGNRMMVFAVLSLRLSCLFFTMMRVEPRLSHMLDKHSTTEF